jgi:hypothetical protein
VETWKRLLQRGGCNDADDVVSAFRRIVEAGAKGTAIPATDILTVRGCGRKLVENLRQKALQVSLLRVPLMLLTAVALHKHYCDESLTRVTS